MTPVVNRYNAILSVQNGKNSSFPVQKNQFYVRDFSLINHQFAPSIFQLGTTAWSLLIGSEGKSEDEGSAEVAAV